jgi:hypothetical protein
LEQVDNVLLIVYNPSDDLDLIDQPVGSPFSSDDTDVALRWPSEGFPPKLGNLEKRPVSVMLMF